MIESWSVKRIPSLDGLRAISILMVVALHCLQRANADHPISQWWFLLGNGDLGVHIFFGDQRLYHHRFAARGARQDGRDQLQKLLPAARFAHPAGRVLLRFRPIGAAALCRPATAYEERGVAGVLFFYANYIPRPWSLDHFWTLAIEEQFYFVWPFVLGLCLKGEKRRTAILFVLR